MGAGEISLNLRITSDGGVPLMVRAPQVHFKPQSLPTAFDKCQKTTGFVCESRCRIRRTDKH
jgi:hypothetical protein